MTTQETASASSSRDTANPMASRATTGELPSVYTTIDKLPLSIQLLRMSLSNSVYLPVVMELVNHDGF